MPLPPKANTSKMINPITGIENNEDNIWGLLVGTGYLKVTETVDLVKKRYKVTIPNYEIKSLFEEIIDDWFKDKVIGNDLNSTTISLKF